MFIILGNLFSLLGSTCSLLSTKAKTYKNTLLIQTLDAFFFTLSCVCLEGYSGIVTNFVAMLRNLGCAFFDLKKWTKILFVVLTIVLGVLFMEKTIYGLLPIVASSFYSIVMIRTKNVLALKKALIFNNILWLIYNVCILDFVGVGFKVVSVVSCLQWIKNQNLRKEKEV